jgi:hypothetical protein
MQMRDNCPQTHVTNRRKVSRVHDFSRAVTHLFTAPGALNENIKVASVYPRYVSETTEWIYIKFAIGGLS